MISLIDNYYSDSTNYPPLILAIGERMRTFLAETVYPDEDIQTAIDERILIADIGASTDEGIRKASEYFGANQKYPFTAYNFDEVELFTDRLNTKGAQGLQYSDALGCLVSCTPLRLEFPAITFCNTPADYERLQKIFYNIQSTHTLIYADVSLNGTTYSYPVRVEVTPVKGQYAFGFQEYLRTNGIYDLSHSFSLYFYDLILDTDFASVDQFDFGLEMKSPIDDSLNETEYSKNYTSTDLPTITSTDPVEEETDVPVGNSVVINFNVTMSEDSVEDAITLYPYFEHKFIWDDDSKILIIDPYFDLSSGTLYTVTIEDSAHAFYVEDVIDEFELTFTTEE